MTKKPQVPWWIEFGLKYWKPISAIAAMLVAVIVFLATLNPRLSASEKKITELEKATISNTALQESTNRLLSQMVQQMAPAQPTVPAWDFLREEGEWNVFRDPTGGLQCCDGTRCVEHPAKGRCPS